MSFRQRWADTNWVALILLPVMVILMEVFLVYPWLVWVGKWPTMVWQRPPLSLLSSVLVMGISCVVTRYFLGRQWSLKWAQMGIIGCGLVVILVVMRLEYGAGFGLFSGQWLAHFGKVLSGSFTQLHPSVVALGAGVYFWWRGISRGSQPIRIDSIYRILLMGIAASAFLIILWRISLGADSLQAAAPAIGPQVAAFFFFGLAALALANLQAIRRNLLPEETTRVFHRRWLPILFGMVGGIVLVAIGIVSIFSSDFIALLRGLFDSGLEMLYRALLYLLIPLGYIAAALVSVVRFLLGFLRKGQPVEPWQRPDFSMAEKLNEAAGPALPEIAVLALKWTLFAVLAAGVIFLLAKVISRYQAYRARAEVEEVDESLWSWEVFKADLRLFVDVLLQRFRRKMGQAGVSSLVASRDGEDETHGILNIRQIYRRLLREASGCGIMRWRHETPHEFACRLCRALPEGSKQVGELTELYIGVRYGDLEADDQQVTYANSLWRVLKGLLSPKGY